MANYTFPIHFEPGETLGQFLKQFQYSSVSDFHDVIIPWELILKKSFFPLRPNYQNRRILTVPLVKFIGEHDAQGDPVMNVPPETLSDGVLNE